MADQSLPSVDVDELCRICRLDRSMVIPRRNGAHRDALMAPGKVFLFPRTRGYAASMLYELDFLRTMNGLHGIPMPRFLDLLELPSVFAGPIGVVSRLEGENWEDIQEQFSWQFIQSAFDELLELLIICHNTPPACVPSVAGSAPAQQFSEQAPMQAWLASSLDTACSEAAVAALHAQILRGARELNLDAGCIEKDGVLDKWTKTVGMLAAMPAALLHGDMHEGQILLQSVAASRISGLLDWEAVQFGNPLMDFSFHKWGWGRVWVFRNEFPGLRRKLWGRYLQRRGLSHVSPDSLHLYCSLTEMLRTLMERDSQHRPLATVTRTGYRESVAEQLATLREATDRA